MSWASEIPPELLCRPMGLTILTGLDLVYNAVHKAIWDSFCNNRRTDRVPLHFKQQNADYDYSKSKPKRTSYEWYIPKGILKTSWMKKHLEHIPAVVVLFFDLDWDEVMWKERQMECATRIEVVRNSLSGRGTKVCMVLIQKNAPLPPGEDVVAAERAASLCTACDLSAKMLFVLPVTDHLLGYTIRLENAFCDLVRGYYHTEARRVKTHKDYLNKTTHALLFVRHQFKIAFYNELKQDSHTALKHYKQAYGHVLELRMLDYNLLEVKTIAGFISYKICRLCFLHNTPLDAIAQFRKHIDFFKSKVGLQDLAFEHSAWLAKQFQVFGDLFDEAIKLGLAAIQTQHPGIYYQQAAYQSINRKQLCHTICQSGSVSTTPPQELLDGLNNLDYYGQRPWRQGHQSIEPPDAIKEKDCILALQGLELQVDHSWIIIPLLGSAVTQFKKYKSPRMKRHLMVQMGEEYYYANDYVKSLALLSRVTWEYRQERWWNLLTSILTTALRCAYLVANVQEYLTLNLELMGKYAQISSEEKNRMQTNLVRVLSNKLPEAEPNCKQPYLDAATAAWKSYLDRGEAMSFTIEMTNIVPFVECKALFVRESFSADSVVTIKVFIRSCAAFPFQFSKLTVLLNNPAYNRHLTVVDEKGNRNESSAQAGDLCVHSSVNHHTFTFVPLQNDVGNVLEITSLNLEIGSDMCRAVLHWSGAGGDAVAPPISQQHNYFHSAIDSTNESQPWEQIRSNPVTRIVARDPHIQLLVKHDPPGLVNELHHFTICITNQEAVTISNVQCSFSFKENMDLEFLKSTKILSDLDDMKSSSHSVNVNLGHLDKEQQVERNFYTSSSSVGELVIVVAVSYDITVKISSSDVVCRCHLNKTVPLAFIDPLAVNIALASLKFDKLESSVYSDQPFLVLTDMKCMSPSPLQIVSSRLELSEGVNFTDKKFVSQVSGVTLNCNDSASECLSLSVHLASEVPVQLGKYIITMKRDSTSSEQIPSFTKTIDLPSVTVSSLPVHVELDIPAYGVVQSNMVVVYNIFNHTPFLQQFEIQMESSEAFMFSGHRQVQIRILPNAKYQLKYNLVPLMAGNVLLPKMHLNMTRYPDAFATLVQKMLPSYVFIQPRSRNSSMIQPGA